MSINSHTVQKLCLWKTYSIVQYILGPNQEKLGNFSQQKSNLLLVRCRCPADALLIFMKVTLVQIIQIHLLTFSSYKECEILQYL